MKVKKILSMSVLAVSILALVACASDRYADGAADTAADSSSSFESNDGMLNGQSVSAEGAVMDEDGQLLTKEQLLAVHTYHFAFNSADVLPVDKAAVIAQAHYLANNPGKRILLAGNTDRRGSREYNIALGWRRAQAVEDLMLLNGASRTQVQLVSYGQEKPIAFGNTEQAYEMNRRVDLTYEN